MYLHEMPGGQYSNLKFQASSLGLGQEWERVKHAYAAASRAMGDIIKVRDKGRAVCTPLAICRFAQRVMTVIDSAGDAQQQGCG